MNEFTIQCNHNLNCTLKVFADDIVRMTFSGYDTPDPSMLERYQLLNPLPEAENAVLFGRRKVSFGKYAVCIDENGGWRLFRDEKLLTMTTERNLPASAPTEKRNAGYFCAIHAEHDEKFLGFGDSQRKQMLLNGLAGELWIRYKTDHVPVPFLMSSRGFGIFFNTTRKVIYDICRSNPEEASVAVAHSFEDIFILTGDSYTELIRKFTVLTGRPHLPPIKSFGLWLLLHYFSDITDLHMTARMLRDKKIPCDNLSLEPGWMENDYDCSAKLDWNLRRFSAAPLDMWRGGVRDSIRILNQEGYNLGLWLCNTWDITCDEERKLADTQKVLSEKSDQLLLSGLVDTHISKPYYLDRNTLRDQDYFEHLKKFADDGISFFKLDGAFLGSEIPDRLYGNGKTDEEMHNLIFTLLAKHTYEDFESYTGKRSYGIFAHGGVGVQRYAGTWTGDTGGGPEPIAGTLQNALVGHTFNAIDVENDSVQGIHAGYLMPWVIVNGWAVLRYPGLLSDTLNTASKEYAELHMSLVLYYYSLAYQASKYGMPVIRPLCIVYPEKEWTYHTTKEFMIGDFLLIDAFADDKIILPEGLWYDFWTGNVYEGNDQSVSIPVPEGRGGHLLLREGTLLPRISVRQYITPGELDSVEWLVFPSIKSEDSFTLYFDDGATLKHRDGDFAVQTVTRTKDRLHFSAVEGHAPEYLNTVSHKITIIGKKK